MHNKAAKPLRDSTQERRTRPGAVVFALGHERRPVGIVLEHLSVAHHDDQSLGPGQRNVEALGLRGRVPKQGEYKYKC